MQAGIEPAARFVDPGLRLACGHRVGGVVHDGFLLLHDPSDLAVADPASVAGLPAALGVKGGGDQGDGEPVFMGYTVGNVNIAVQRIVGKKKALGHGCVPERVSFFSIRVRLWCDNPLNYQWTCAL